MKASFDEAGLVKEYTPVLVLYPELPPGSTRDEARKGYPGYPQISPLPYDCHPRDIRMVLEHSSFHSAWALWSRSSRQGRDREDKGFDWRKMLDLMEQSKYAKDLDVLPGVSPSDSDRFWKAYAEIPKDGEAYQRLCYARVVHGEGVNSGRVVVQYWYAYFYNDYWNVHEMDWETVMLVFKLTDAGPRPTVCAYSAHFGGHWLPWRDVEKVNASPVPDEHGTHPAVYVANGSHGNYFYGPAVYRTASPTLQIVVKMLTGIALRVATRLRWPVTAGLLRLLKPRLKRELLDYTTSWAEGSHLLIEAKLIPPPENPDGSGWTGEWRWLNHKGRWGSPGMFPKIRLGDSGPYGPPRAREKWENPFQWIDTQCVLTPSRLEVQRPTSLEP